MEPLSPNEYRPKFCANTACATLDISTGKLTPLVKYNKFHMPKFPHEKPQFRPLLKAGLCTGKLVIVASKVPGATPTFSIPDAPRTGSHLGTAFVVAHPPENRYPGVDGDVAAVLMTARHVVQPNYSYLSYDPVAIYYIPEADVDLAGFDCLHPERFENCRLYKCQVVDVASSSTPLRSVVNGATHTVNGDAAVLVAIQPAVNEEILMDIVLDGDLTAADVYAKIRPNTSLVPCLDLYRGKSTDVASVGFPGLSQRHVPQEYASDFSMVVRGPNPFCWDRLNDYFHGGKSLVAGLGEVAQPLTMENAFANDGFSAIISTGSGMSGGPVIDLNCGGTVCGVIVGCATTSPLQYLTNELFEALTQENIDTATVTRISQMLGNIRIDTDLAMDNEFDRRERILQIIDMCMIKTEAEMTLAQLNYNHILGVAGPSFAQLYRNRVLPYVTTDHFTEDQRVKFEEYCAWLATLP